MNSDERNSESKSNSNDGNSNSIPIPPGLGQANSITITIPELDLEFARKSNSGAELTPALSRVNVLFDVKHRGYVSGRDGIIMLMKYMH